MHRVSDQMLGLWRRSCPDQVSGGRVSCRVDAYGDCARVSHHCRVVIVYVGAYPSPRDANRGPDRGLVPLTVMRCGGDDDADDADVWSDLCLGPDPCSSCRIVSPLVLQPKIFQSPPKSFWKQDWNREGDHRRVKAILGREEKVGLCGGI